MEPTTQGAFTQPVQDTLFDLQDLTVKSAKSISSLKAEIKQAQQMIKDALASNSAYVTQQQSVNTTKKALAIVKFQLEQLPENNQLLGKLKDLREELKEKRIAVSDYALEYERMSGQSEFEINGEAFSIVKTAKLVKRSS